MKYSLLLSIICFVLLCSCHKNDTAKPDHSGLFIKFFGDAKNGSGFSVKESGDGGYIIVGSVIPDGRQDKDLYIVKTDADGNKIWDNKYGDIYDQEGSDVKIDNAGNFLVAGYTTAKNDSTDFLVLQYNKDGILLKTFIYGQADRNEAAKFISTTSDGGVLVAGSIEQLSSKQINMYLVKTNLDTLIWQKSIGLNTLYNSIGTIVEMPSKNLLWCGTVNRGNETDLRITSTDEYSNLNWDYSIGENNGINESGMEIQPTTDGNYIIGGTQISGGNSSALLVKIDSLGTSLWQTQPGGSGKIINSVYPSKDGGFVLAGSMSDNYLLMKTDGNGGESWEQNYGGNQVDQANKVIQTSDGGYLMIGTVTVSNHTLLGLMKMNNNGKLSK
jgi:hypothetical protein